MSRAAGERGYFVGFRLGDLPGIDAGDASAVDVDLHHDPMRFGRHLFKHRLQHIHHELHRCVVVVEQDNRILRRLLPFDVDPFLDGAIGALFAACHSRKYTIGVMSARVAAAVLLAGLVPVVLSSQRAAPPDLSGTWSFSTLTALERPAEFAGKEFLTDEEAAAFAKRTMERNNRDNRDPSNREADVGGAYNEFWWDRGTTVAKVRGKYRTSLIVDPPDGRVPALTPAAQERAAARAAERRAHPADGPEDRSLGERCLVFNAGPPMMPGPYNNFVQIVQTHDHLVIHNEMIHDARVIPLDGRPHAPSQMRLWLGDSRGRWDDRTLVVDTTNYTDKTNLRGSSPQLHLVERFTLTDANTLLYEFTVDDPSSFVKPWTVALPMRKTTEQVFEYACHEGNQSLQGILRGARFEEQAKRH